ncbi:MAG: glycosyltransferase, partial [Chloroflexota bacterium]|nr:glycosyltransferase [Chloroflexota bacterium]
LRSGHEVISLSAGDRYTVFGAATHIVFEGNAPERAVVVNSPVFAPSHSAFHAIHRYAEDRGLDGIPAQLRTRYGRLDVLHFQNIEGLTAGFLRAMRLAFPEAQMLLTAHNYTLVCPQVNLWFREQRACADYQQGRACANCLMAPNLHRFQRSIRRTERILGALGIERGSPLLWPVRWAVRAPFRLKRRLEGLRRGRHQAATECAPLVLVDDRKAQDYQRYRETNAMLAAEVFDGVLAVSERTKHVLVRRGVPAEKIAVSYIGTAHAARFQTARQVTEPGPNLLHIAYLGYMRADKGFYFLLDSLNSLPESWARRLAVTIAAPAHDQGAVERLRSMAHRFAALTLHDGYTHATLDCVLEGVHLGIVPPLWEDALPQVAIEMVARGIPILTSDRGGAREIAPGPAREAFTFAAGSTESFQQRLHCIMTGQVSLARFWDGPIRLLSMEDHLQELMAHYYQPSSSKEQSKNATMA